MTPAATLPSQIDRIQRVSLMLGILLLGVCVGAAFVFPAQFFKSYLLAFLFWVSLALGSFAVLMLHHMFHAGWGFVIQRMLESGTRTFLLMAVLFVPLLFGLHSLYEWTHTDAVAADPVLLHKQPYLNVPFFIARTVLYFVLWIGAAFFLNRWSLQLDQSGSPALAQRLENVSAPGLLLYGLTVTFASIDWMMSLEPHWYSTIYGLLFIGGQVLATLAFVIIVAMLLSDQKPLADVVRPSHFHDLGNLLFAFVMIWAYLDFSQFLITWSGNLPAEITWYSRRIGGGWQYLALALVVLDFALPFVLLLSRRTKRRAHALALVAGLILVMRLVDLYWMVTPAFHPSGLSVHWMDVLLPVGMGGIWVAYFVHQLKSRPILPLRDPRMVEAFEHAEGH